MIWAFILGAICGVFFAGAAVFFWWYSQDLRQAYPRPLPVAATKHHSRTVKAWAKRDRLDLSEISLTGERKGAR